VTKSTKKKPVVEPKAVLGVTQDGMRAATGSESACFQGELIDQVTAALWKPEMENRGSEASGR
jgi:hypothetical protein